MQVPPSPGPSASPPATPSLSTLTRPLIQHALQGVGASVHVRPETGHRLGVTTGPSYPSLDLGGL